MKVIDGNFPEYVISCNVDHDIIKTLLIAVSWQDDKSVWVLVWDELNAVLDTIGVTFESFQEGCSEAIAMYERGREVIEKRNLMEIVQ
jgi:hypothetical protein